MGHFDKKKKTEGRDGALVAPPNTPVASRENSPKTSPRGFFQGDGYANAGPSQEQASNYQPPSVARI